VSQLANYRTAISSSFGYSRKLKRRRRSSGLTNGFRSTACFGKLTSSASIFTQAALLSVQTRLTRLGTLIP
jgi:hypothetical protein